MKNKQNSFISGLTSLVMVFIVLCMTIFASLYFVQANANYKMAKRNYEYKKAYYDADYEAMSIYETINNEIKDMNYDEIEIYLKSMNITLENDIINYSIEINTNQQLNVDLLLNFDEYYYLDVIKWVKEVKNNESYDKPRFDF